MKTFTKNQKVRIVFTENNTALFATAKYLGSEKADEDGRQLHKVKLLEDISNSAATYDKDEVLYMNDEEVYAMEEK